MTTFPGFESVEDDARLWTPDGLLGLVADEEAGTWRLLDCQGRGAAGALTPSDAAHILARCYNGSGYDAEETKARWEAYASSAPAPTTCRFCGVQSREVRDIDDSPEQPYLRNRGIIGLPACPACYEEQRADAEQAAAAEASL